MDQSAPWIGTDAIALREEKDVDMIFDPFDPIKSQNLKSFKNEPLLEKVMENGKRTKKPVSLQEIAAFCKGRVEKLPQECERFENPHIYKVGISGELRKERERLIYSVKK